MQIFLSPPSPTLSLCVQYAGILEQVVEVARSLEVWREQPQLCGEMALKLACLSESSATDSPHTHHGGTCI